MKNIVIIGGGITGTITANELLQKNSDITIEIFDWGRFPGGRIAHRHMYINKDKDEYFDPTDNSDELHFDHGCQFIRVKKSSYLDQAILNMNNNDIFENITTEINNNIDKIWLFPNINNESGFFSYGVVDKNNDYKIFRTQSSNGINQLIFDMQKKLINTN